PLELRLAGEHRQDAGDPLAGVAGGDVQPPHLHLVRVHGGLYRFYDARLEPGFVRPAVGRADAVDVGADRLVGRFGPLEGGLDLAVAVAGLEERQLRDLWLLSVRDQLAEELRDAAG